MAKTKKKISAIAACYNESKSIPLLYKRLTNVFKKIKTDYEIIFVNDGSSDNSENVLKHLVQKDHHVIGINLSRSFNSHMAFTSGMNYATGDAVVLLDGDLQDPPELIEKFYKKWLDGYDVVYGIREKRKAPLYMSFFYKLFYRIFNKMSYVHIPLDAGEFSLMDRKVVDAIKRFQERDRFLRGLRAWVGYKQTGVPFVRPDREYGTSTNNLLKNINWAFLGIFSFSYVPLQMLTTISFILFLIAILGIVYEIVIRIMFPHLPPGITAVLIVVLFLGSIQLLGISIIGQYIGRIFEEVKQRPGYIIKSIYQGKKIK